MGRAALQASFKRLLQTLPSPPERRMMLLPELEIVFTFTALDVAVNLIGLLVCVGLIAWIIKDR